MNIHNIVTSIRTHYRIPVYDDGWTVCAKQGYVLYQLFSCIRIGPTGVCITWAILWYKLYYYDSKTHAHRTERKVIFCNIPLGPVHTIYELPDKSSRGIILKALN